MPSDVWVDLPSLQHSLRGMAQKCTTTTCPTAATCLDDDDGRSTTPHSTATRGHLDRIILGQFPPAPGALREVVDEISDQRSCDFSGCVTDGSSDVGRQPCVRLRARVSSFRAQTAYAAIWTMTTTSATCAPRSSRRPKPSHKHQTSPRSPSERSSSSWARPRTAQPGSFAEGSAEPGPGQRESSVRERRRLP